MTSIPNLSRAATTEASLYSSYKNSGAGAAVQVAQTAFSIAQIAGSNLQEEQKIQAIREQAALAVADYYTAGLASVFYGWANKQWGGTMEKLRKLDAKYNPATIILTKLFDSDKWKTEGNRVRELLENGVQIPESLQGRMHQTRGYRKEELIDPSVPLDFMGYKSDGTWSNNKFTMSRNEADLRPQDIWGYATFFEKFGNDWLGTFTEEKRTQIAQLVLDAGAVREHHGTIDITWSPELEQAAAAL